MTYALCTSQKHVLKECLVCFSAVQTKEEIAKEVQDELSKAFAAFGYEILQALVTDIDPDPRVKAAMNEVGGAS
jgi:regulator of protease activity HflC (stomatin/prohibitin superfamily)